VLKIVLNIIRSVELPDVVGDLFIFGSVTRSSSPRDIDLLLVIDESIVSPKNAYALATHLEATLEAATSLPIHLTILTQRESLRTDFVNIVGAKVIRRFEGKQA
jgi:predicted nucleotidyltransferase